VGACYVLEPALDGRRTLATGEPLELGINLIGSAADLMPYLIAPFPACEGVMYAVVIGAAMGSRGGRRRLSCKGST